MSPYNFETRMNRRRALIGLGGASLLGLADVPACSDDEVLVSSTADCVLTPRQSEGPFYVESSMIREDMTEDKEGIALGVDLTIVDATRCEPIEGAVVDI